MDITRYFGVKQNSPNTSNKRPLEEKIDSPPVRQKILVQPSLQSLSLPLPTPQLHPVLRKADGKIDYNASLAYLVAPKARNYTEKELDGVFKKQKRKSAFEKDEKTKKEEAEKQALEKAQADEVLKEKRRFRQNLTDEELQTRRGQLDRLNSKLRAGESLIQRQGILGSQSDDDDNNNLDAGVTNTDLALHDLVSQSWRSVLGQGRVDAELMIIVDFPTKKECETGKAFSSDRSKRLKDILLSAGINVDKYCYVTNLMKIGKRRKVYSFDEVDDHLEYLLEEIRIIRPKQILCMGPLITAIAHNAFQLNDSMRQKNSIWVAEGEREDGVRSVNLYDLQKRSIDRKAVQFPQFQHVANVFITEEVGKFFEKRENERFRTSWITKLGQLKDSMSIDRYPFLDLNEALNEYHYNATQQTLDEAAESQGVEFSEPERVKFESELPDLPYNPNLHLELQEKNAKLRFYLIERIFSKEENAYVLYGKLNTGSTISVIVNNPKFFFWVNHHSFMPRSGQGDSHIFKRPEINELYSALRFCLLSHFQSAGYKFAQLTQDEIWDSIGLKLEWDLKRTSIGFQRIRSTFLKIHYKRHEHLPVIQKYLREILINCNFFEANVNPIKLLELEHEVRSFSWVEVDSQALEIPKRRFTSSKYEYEVDAFAVSGKDSIKRENYQPNPEDESHAAVRTLVLDGEMIKILATNDSLPIPEVHPIGRLCAIVSDKNDPRRPTVLDAQRHTKPGHEREVVSSGRCNYSQAVAFVVGAHKEVQPRKFGPQHLPWYPKRPKSPPSKTFNENLVECRKRIRKWNEFIAKLVDWVFYVGSYRSKKILPDRVHDWLQSYIADKDSIVLTLSEESRKNPEIYAQWRSNVTKVYRSWVKRASEQSIEWPDVQPPENVTGAKEVGWIQFHWNTFNPKVKHFFFRDERSMLAGFVEYCRSADIDGFSGHNICNFDMNYIIKRLRVLDIRWDEFWDHRGNGLLSLGRHNYQTYGRFSQLSKDVLDRKVMETSANGKREFTIVQVPGRFSFDTLHWAQKDAPPGLPGVGLGRIAEKLLRDKKGDLPWTSIPHQFLTKPDNLTDYCSNDAELCERITNICDVQSFVVTSNRIIGDLTLGEFYNTGVQRKNVSIYQTRLRKSKLNKIFPDENPFSRNEKGEYIEGEENIGKENNPEGDDEDENDELAEEEATWLNAQKLPADHRERLLALLKGKIAEKSKGRKKAGYSGAYVIDIVKGFYHGVPIISLDFASLYPSIMEAYNLGLNTIGTLQHFLDMGYTEADLYTSGEEYPNPWDNWKPCKWYFLKRRRLTKEEAEKLPAFDDQPAGLAQCTENADGTYTPSLEISDFAAILAFLKSLRNYYKALMKKVGEKNPLWKAYNAAQLAVKILMNSLYGATGVRCGKLACLPIGASVTCEGRRTLKNVKRSCKHYFEGRVVGGDTDSVFVIFRFVKKPKHVFKEIEMPSNPELPPGPDNPMLKLPFIKHVLRFINTRVPSPMSLEFEKLYLEANLQAKKRGDYATKEAKFDPDTKKMVFKMEPLLKIFSKGTEVRRRSTAPYAKKILKGFDKLMLGDHTKSIPERKANATKFVRDSIKKILDGDFEYSDMVMTSYYGKSDDQYSNRNHPTLVINRKRQQRGEEPYQLGERVPRVVVVHPDPKAKFYERVEDPLYAMKNGIPLDLSYYIEKQLRVPLCRKIATIDPSMATEMFADVDAWTRKLKPGQALFAYMSKKCELCGTLCNAKICSDCSRTKTSSDVERHYQGKIETLQTVITKQNNVCYDCLGMADRTGDIACVNIYCKDLAKRVIPTAQLSDLYKTKEKISKMLWY